ncbi:MAG: streptomycin 6-kinase, partial [Patiriisocius sp.]
RLTNRNHNNMSRLLEKLPTEVQLKAHRLGEVGASWLSSLDEMAAGLESSWSLTLGEVLVGGTEALVIEAVMTDGTLAVLKLGLPGSADISAEVKAYELVAGSGYARLLRYETHLNALLLERLGSHLGKEDRSVESQIHLICESLAPSWIKLEQPQGFMTGAEKAEWLAEFIERQWQESGKPCHKKTAYRAVDYCIERADAFSLENSFLVHGDAHSQNLLSVPNSSEYKFVDPEGLCAERACDLAVPMREWSEELLKGNTVKLARQRCNLLSRLTEEDEHAIWQWGYMERISTALLLFSIDMTRQSEMMLLVADRIVDQSV